LPANSLLEQECLNRNTSSPRWRAMINQTPEDLSPEMFSLYQAAFDNSNEAIAVLNQGGEIILANNKSGEFLGITGNQLVGKTLFDIFPKEVAEEYYGSVQEVFASGKEIAAENPIKINGATRWFRSRLKPLKGEQGDVAFVFSHIIDTTEHKQAIVSGDPCLMEAVLTNLISNAIKFTSTKKPAEIEFGHILRKKQDIFYLKDNGIGFNMQYTDKLFAPFQRFDTVSEFEGTGIGLTIVQQIIERHQGSVWAESRVGEGTTFYFHL
jgi:PAS domain S-box-containing protein